MGIKREGRRLILPGLTDTVRNGITALKVGGTALTLGAALAACGHVATAPYYPTCIDPITGHILDPVWCTTYPHTFYYWMSPTSYPVTAYGYPYNYTSYAGYGSFRGSSTTVVVINRTTYTSNKTGYFRADDSTARTNAGLSPSGAVTSKVTSSKGGFDGTRSDKGKPLSPAAKSANNSGSKSNGSSGSKGGGGSKGGSSGHGTAGG